MLQLRVEDLVERSRVALDQLEGFSQEEIDTGVKAIALAIANHAEELAIEAVEETGLGNVESKIAKNKEIGMGVWWTMKDKKSVGIIDADEEMGIYKVAHPKGIIGCITPSTNPTLTILGNAMISLKGRNTVLVSPHPSALKTSVHTVEIMNKALADLNFPENTIQIVEEPTLEASQAVMSMADIVVATGGPGMVKAAYSSGRPSYGVGQGNVQVIIDPDYTDFDKIAENVVFSRTFDNGILCAGEQSLIIPEKHEKSLIEAFKKKGVYVNLEEENNVKLREVLFHNGAMARDAVGKTAPEVGKMAGIPIPEDASMLLTKVTKHGADELLSGEKMCNVVSLNTYTDVDFKEALKIAKDNLNYQGAGHSTVLYSNNKENIFDAGKYIPVGRLLINVPGLAATGVGIITNLNPTSSIGCGSWGNNSISENLTYEHLINISSIAFERTQEIDFDAIYED